MATKTAPAAEQTTETQAAAAPNQPADAKPRKPLWDRLPRGDQFHGIGGAYVMDADGKRKPAPDSSEETPA